MNMLFIFQMLASFILGSLLTLIIIAIKNHSKIFKIRRFYAYLPQARDVYNQVSFQFDKQFDDFKLLKMKLIHDKKRNAYVIEATYKTLKGKRFSF